MQKWVNFLRGSARLEISGPFPERFLNLCSVEGLGFWKVEVCSQTALRLTVALWDVRRAGRLAEKAGCTARRVGGGGLPVFLCAFRRRYALLAGLALSALTAAFLSRFILVVKVTGNDAVPDSVILTELEELGFHFGTYGPTVNERDLANRMLEALPELSFLAINISGVYAEVVVREAVEVPEVRDEDTPTDVVAARDGVIVDVNAFSGSVSVAEGDAVLAGETLISHLSVYEPAEWSDGQTFTSTTHARGEVWALTERTLTAKTPLRAVTVDAASGGKTVYSLRLGKNVIKFRQNSSNSMGNCDKIKKAWHLTLPGGIVLPLAWEAETLTPYSETVATVSAASAEAYLKAQLENRLTAILGDGQVLGRSWTVTEDSDALTVTLEASCLEDIAKEETVAEETEPQEETE
ncbi:MAG: sporulation protein YqfD [Clostridiales bacterium]|nr:sporulation protein YqfD [Clostridiales bacterium]